jgi:fimbrial chaperone protein
MLSATLWLAAIGYPLSSAADSPGSIQISPVSVQVPADEPQATIDLVNNGTHPWSAEAELYAWHQQDDDEQLQPARDLAVSPSRFVLAPGAHQRLRLVRLTTPPAQTERSYRLIVSELPTATTTPRLRYSAPVFVLPTALPAPPQLYLRLEPGATPRLYLHNAGPQHARLEELTFVSADGRRQHLQTGLAGYVLPGSARSWILPARADNYAGGHFMADLNGQGEREITAAPP